MRSAITSLEYRSSFLPQVHRADNIQSQKPDLFKGRAFLFLGTWHFVFNYPSSQLRSLGYTISCGFAEVN